MAPDLRLLSCIFMLTFSVHQLHAQNDAYRFPDGASRFNISVRSGYGITTSNFKDRSQEEYIHGITLSFSLGYRCSDHLNIEAGPAFWLSAYDVFESNAAGKEKPVDKRTLVTLTGAYSISDDFPLTIRLGAGGGNLVYTPRKKTLSTGEAEYAKTEIIAAVGGLAGISYPFRLSQKATLFTGINCWYMELREPQISYDSKISTEQSSITSELFVQLQYHF